MPSVAPSLSAPRLYGLIVVIFQLGTLLLPAPRASMEGVPPPAVARFPTLRLRHQVLPPAQAEARIDVVELRRSVLRLPVADLIRRASNSLHLALGQMPGWAFRSGGMLYLKNEIPLAEGLTPANRIWAEDAVRTITDLHRRFSREEWKLMLVMVPSKLSITGETIAWPLLEADPFTRQPIDRDHSDEVCDWILDHLRTEGVHFVDLRAEFRTATRENDPAHTIFPPGESHWSAYGVSLVADRVAEALGKLGLQTRSADLSAGYRRYRLSADIADRFDHLAGWPRWLARLANFDETISLGSKPAAARPEDRRAIVAVAGTSYTGQYSWLGNAGLVAELDRRLPNAIVRSYAEAGRGSLQAAKTFIEEKSNLLRELDQQRSTHRITRDAKYLVWEFPLRDLQGFATPIDWHNSSIVLDGPDGNLPSVVLGDGFYPPEVQHGSTFHWARQKSRLVVNTRSSGRYQLTFRPITAFHPKSGTLRVSSATETLAVIPLFGTDFANPPAQTLELTLVAGPNELILQADFEEIQFGKGDERQISFGLILPLDVVSRPAGPPKVR